ncbi:hypothetical protein PIIN_04181 [Serendipita indica DSM 11827]|uniref:Uncharacterized protein n=1 Tax=Serendipita indica (strain DSM 11827) TaxID=1109443 RepID=G4TFZ3_SERID|nr:hypothetical protein PIIN_04181 [Serendipita indica DSM 11827]
MIRDSGCEYSFKPRIEILVLCDGFSSALQESAAKAHDWKPESDSLRDVMDPEHEQLKAASSNVSSLSPPINKRLSSPRARRTVPLNDCTPCIAWR